ncbi:temptin [Plakobranchus ocellatus]|uniref:Temptin n=1 Tax=Plakobranchus ocellatus TaxID=259542 RepID=A0AAV4AFM8_9GAST|nr:temptin [Plakobranchus ocellatus]
MWNVLTLSLLVVATLGYPNYKPLIPNGFSVPNPCGNGFWRGVGHLAEGGTGPLNPFGADFAANGHVWDRALCMGDSDGDGKTNGEELGDAHCHWTVDNPKHLSSASGHPGICDPIGSAACAGSVFKC